MTLREALAHATSQIDASPGLRADAHRDAVLLLLHTLGISRAALLADPGRTLTLPQQAAYQGLILRRLAHEPIQYIIGEQEFYGLALHVTPAVLIPRPETELLVEAVLAELGSHSAESVFHSAESVCHSAESVCHSAVQRRNLLSLSPPPPPLRTPLRILDVGTGSGAVAIALAHHLPQAHITAVDLSPAALAVAAANAVRHRLTSRIHLLASDLLDALGPGEAGFDAIVSNPPYVPTADRETLHPQVRDHEPAAALFAGPDGLDVYRRLIPQARAALNENGLLALEIGHGQREPIAELLAGWNQLRFLDDLQHIARVTLVRKP